MDGFFCLKWNNHGFSFLQNLKHFHDKELYCDATLACHGNFYPVHKLVLATCSDYFKEIFEKAECKHPFIILKDITPKALESLLDYMYNGEVNVLQETILELIQAADALRIKGLAISDEINSSESLNNLQFQKERKRSLSPASHISVSSLNYNTNSNKKVRLVSNSETGELIKKENLEDESNLSPSKLHYSCNESKEVAECSLQLSEGNEKLEQEDEDDSFDDNSVNFLNANSNTMSGDTPLFSSFLFGEKHHSLIDTDENYPLNPFLNITTTLSANANEMNNCPDDETNLNETVKREKLKDLSHALEATRNILSMNSFLKKNSNMETPFHCELCSYRCKKETFLHKHILRKHLQDEKTQLNGDENGKVKNELKCCYCTYTTIQPSRLKSHMSIHTGYRPYSCTYCLYKSTQSGTMKRHIQKVHKDKFEK